MGVDFDQTFAVIIKLMAFQALFVIIAFYDLDIEWMDIKIAFLHGIINQLLYIEVPKRYEDQ